MKKLLSILTISLILLLTSPAFGVDTDYCVDCGAGSNGDGSYGSPFNSIAALQAKIDDNTISDGDDIYFRKGVTCALTSSAETLNLSRIDGSASEITVIGCYEGNGNWCEAGEYAIIDGDGRYPSSNYKGAFHKSSGSGTHGYIEIGNIWVKNLSSSTKGISAVRFLGDEDGNSVNVYVHNMKVTDWNSVGASTKGIAVVHYHGTADPPWATSAQDGVLIENNYLQGLTGGAGDLGILFDGANKADLSYNATIRGNTLKDCDVEGIASYRKSRNVVIEKNVIYGLVYVGIYAGASSEIDIRYNLIYVTQDHLRDNYVGIYVSMEDPRNYCTLRDVRVYGNMVAAAARGFHWRNQEGNDGDRIDCNPTGLKLYNNTAVDCTVYNYSFDQSLRAGDGVAKNNKSWILSGGKHVNGPSQTGWTFSHNHYNSTVTGRAADNTVIDTVSLVKSSGWQTLSHGELDGSEFQPTSGDKGLDAGTKIASYNDRIKACNYTASLFSVTIADGGNPPDIGAWMRGTIGITLFPSPKNLNLVLQ